MAVIAPDIVRLSPNVNRYPDGVGTPVGMPPTCKCVIIHCTRSGVPGNPSEFEGTLGYMSRKGTTSSHWVVSRTGVKARVVPDSQEAWHAGTDNDNAWGIEIEQGVASDGFTDVQLAAVVEICKGYRDDFNVPAYHSTTSAEGFIGHEETIQGRSYGKSDPGYLFPWDWFIAQLQESPMPERQWLYGNEQAGEEVVGNQIFIWHLGIVINKIGDEAGLMPGRREHNEGGTFVVKEP